MGELNGQHIKLAKIKGEFIWHKHEEEDEFFMVLEGQLIIELRDKKVVLNKNDFLYCLVHKLFSKETFCYLIIFQ